MSKHNYCLALSLLVFSGCSSLYMPNVPNTPMLSSAGELHASGHISLKGNVSLNTAYAALPNFGVIVNGEFINREQHKKDFRQSLLEVGAGYFDIFGLESNRIIEIYGGLGKGKSEQITTNTNSSGEMSYDRTEMSFTKKFIQVNYSSKKKRSLHVFGKDLPLNYGTAIRGSYIRTKNFKVNDADQSEEDNIFIEPVFFTRMHLSDAVQLQYTTGSNFGLKNRKYFTAGNSVFSLGISINVGGR